MCSLPEKSLWRLSNKFLHPVSRHAIRAHKYAIAPLGFGCRKGLDQYQVDHLEKRTDENGEVIMKDGEPELWLNFDKYDKMAEEANPTPNIEYNGPLNQGKPQSLPK